MASCALLHHAEAAHCGLLLHLNPDRDQNHPGAAQTHLHTLMLGLHHFLLQPLLCPTTRCVADAKEAVVSKIGKQVIGNHNMTCDQQSEESAIIKASENKCTPHHILPCAWIPTCLGDGSLLQMVITCRSGITNGSRAKTMLVKSCFSNKSALWHNSVYCVSP